MNVKIDSESIHPMMDYLIVNQKVLSISEIHFRKYESSQSIAKTLKSNFCYNINDNQQFQARCNLWTNLCAF